MTTGSSGRCRRRLRTTRSKTPRSSSNGTALQEMAERDPTAEQRRRIRRSAIVLAVVAIAIYVAFIASGVMKAQP